MKGLQIAPVNVAQNFKGLQIGVVNISKSMKGVPIGLLSIIDNSLPYGRIWTDESGVIEVGLHSGPDFLYTIFASGIRPYDFPFQWNLGYGIGSKMKFNRLCIAIEDIFLHTSVGSHWENKIVLHNKFMLNINVQHFRRFAYWFGPSLNLIISKKPYINAHLTFLDVNLYKFRKKWYAVWPGFQVGVQF